MIEAYSPCPLCGSTLRQLVFTLEMGRIVRCAECSLVSMVGRHDRKLITCDYDRSYFFPSAEKSVGYPDYFASESQLRTHVADHLALALTRRFPSTKKSVDVGCGGGYLVGALRRLHLDAWGVDPADAVLAGAAADVRSRLARGGIDSPDMSERAPYDLVTAMDVIEHVPDPVWFLRSAFRLLRPGGTLVILTPRFGGRLSDTQGRAYVHFNVDHVYYFTENSLRHCCVLATAVEPTLMEVMTFWRLEGVEVVPEVQLKYTESRDSMIALCSKPA